MRLVALAAAAQAALASAADSLSVESIISIAPSTATCAGAPSPNECRTAAQAAPAINQAFATYGITHGSVQSALLSLMLYESDNFKYNHNISPGRPGQGTRNMQLARWNRSYAQSLGVATADSSAGMSDSQVLEAVLALGDGADFGSAAWYTVTQCSVAYREDMWGGNEAGFEEWLGGCVDAGELSERMALWKSCMAVLGSD